MSPRDALQLFALSAIWGASFILIRIGVREIPPTWLVVGRLLAGIVVIAPSAGFAWRVSATSVPVGQELGAARRLIGGGIAKLLVTFGLLVVAFAWLRPEPVAFFVTMMAMQAVYWFSPIMGPE